jgi:hypothetical protein
MVPPRPLQELELVDESVVFHTLFMKEMRRDAAFRVWMLARARGGAP